MVKRQLSSLQNRRRSSQNNDSADFFKNSEVFASLPSASAIIKSNLNRRSRIKIQLIELKAV
jgi:hypothetical protein